MAKTGDVLEIPELGMRVEFVETATGSDGAVVAADVIGRPRGFIARAHVHRDQVERHTVLAGEMKLVIDGAEHRLGPGDSMEVPAGAPHRQLASGLGPGRVRIELRPARRTEAFLERLAELSREGRFNRFGFPSPTAAARLVRDFASEGHAAAPPVAVQRVLAGAILGVAGVAGGARASIRALADGASGEYVFIDEWDVAAPVEAVFDALADARSYPLWWRPVYLDVEAEDGPPAVGKVARQHFKGRLPYHLRTRSEVVRLEAPHVIEVDVDGDLRGHGAWTLARTAAGTHVRFDWRVHADRRLLRALTPVLRPALRWNHAWAIERAIDGLEPYARSAATATGRGPTRATTGGVTTHGAPSL